MNYSPSKRHRFKRVHADELDKYLQQLHTERADVLQVLPLSGKWTGHKIEMDETWLGVVYREPIQNVIKETPKEFLAKAHEIYEVYPRKQGKKTGIAKLAKSLEKGQDFDMLMEATRAFADFHKNTDKQYIPHFTTYVNQQIWDWVDKCQEQTEDDFDFIED